MQTFLPFSDYTVCARILDNKRLGSQCKECKQIITALHLGKGAWRNHPATKMWEKYPYQLCIYTFIMCEEWEKRGNKVRAECSWLKKHEFYTNITGASPKPNWLGDERLHSSHRRALLVKNWNHYKDYFADIECVEKPLQSAQYFWPSHCTKYGGTGDGYLKGKYVIPNSQKRKIYYVVS